MVVSITTNLKNKKDIVKKVSNNKSSKFDYKVSANNVIKISKVVTKFLMNFYIELGLLLMTFLLKILSSLINCSQLLSYINFYIPYRELRFEFPFL